MELYILRTIGTYDGVNYSNLANWIAVTSVGSVRGWRSYTKTRMYIEVFN